MWTADGSVVGEGGILAKFEVTELEKEEYHPKKALELTFPWSDCMEIPDIKCEDFPTQELNDKAWKTNVNTGEKTYELLPGVCLPKEGNP